MIFLAGNQLCDGTQTRDTPCKRAKNLYPCAGLYSRGKQNKHNPLCQSFTPTLLGCFTQYNVPSLPGKRGYIVPAPTPRQTNQLPGILRQPITVCTKPPSNVGVKPCHNGLCSFCLPQLCRHVLLKLKFGAPSFSRICGYRFM